MHHFNICLRIYVSHEWGILFYHQFTVKQNLWISKALKSLMWPTREGFTNYLRMWVNFLKSICKPFFVCLPSFTSSLLLHSPTKPLSSFPLLQRLVLFSQICMPFSSFAFQDPPPPCFISLSSCHHFSLISESSQMCFSQIYMSTRHSYVYSRAF